MPLLKESIVFDKNDNVKLYTLSNEKKTLIVKIMDYGATIVQILFNDNNQNQRDLVLGFDQLSDYKNPHINSYFGSTIGRVANRIANGKFELNNQTYKLYQNNGTNSLHGGLVGFDKRKWKLIEQNNSSLILQYTSFNGEEGYPGTLETTIQFSVTNSNALRIKYQSKLLEFDKKFFDKKTIISLTNHSYFNLNGCYNKETSKIFDHHIRLYSDHYLELDDDKTSLPNGKISSVKGTPFELNQHDKPSLTIGEQNFQYDHCMVMETDPNKWFHLNDDSGQNQRQIKIAAEVFAPKTGIKMTFSTDEPGFQFYIGKFIAEKGVRPKKTQKSSPDSGENFELGPNSGFCLEAQRFPNAINVDEWRHQMILNPNSGRYSQETIYQFELAENI